MNQDKKRFSCSGCGYEAITKYVVEQHIKKSKTLHKDLTTQPYVIDTPTITCKYCQKLIKSRTAINHMEEHLKTCSEKSSIASTIINNNTQNIQNIQNNYINITINPYYAPNTSHLIYAENLARNRIELFKQTFFNKDVPQNHSLVYDEKSNMIRVYTDNNKYINVELKNLMVKVSSPLDKIQEQLLKDNVIDKAEFERINKLIDATYGEDEAKNMYRYGEITREYQDIPKRTRFIIDQEREHKELEKIVTETPLEKAVTTTLDKE